MSPGALRTAPGEPPKPPQTTPGELSGYPWASKRTPGVVLGTSGPHFGTPGPFLPVFLTFPDLLFSLLFSFFSLFSRICCSFHPRFFYLFSSPILSARVSLRASLRSIQRFFINGTLNRRNPNISNLTYLTALLLTFRAPPLRNSSLASQPKSSCEPHRPSPMDP